MCYFFRWQQSLAAPRNNVNRFLYFRFTAGVVHSFTGNGEERDQLLAIPNLYIGNSLDSASYVLCGLEPVSRDVSAELELRNMSITWNV